MADMTKGEALRDAVLTGTSFIKDGKRVDPQDVYPHPAPTSAEVEALCERLSALGADGELVNPDGPETTRTLRALATEREAMAVGNKRLRAALEWYAAAVSGCRKIGANGDDARNALDHDGGRRAREALGSDNCQPEKRMEK